MLVMVLVGALVDVLLVDTWLCVCVGGRKIDHELGREAAYMLAGRGRSQDRQGSRALLTVTPLRLCTRDMTNRESRYDDEVL